MGQVYRDKLSSVWFPCVPAVVAGSDTIDRLSSLAAFAPPNNMTDYLLAKQPYHVSCPEHPLHSFCYTGCDMLMCG